MFERVEVNDQPSKERAAIPREAKASQADQIRLNDLIPKNDVKAGRRTVFGAKPKNQQHNKPPI
jgi:hypothetical protein